MAKTVTIKGSIKNPVKKINENAPKKSGKKKK